MVVILGTHVPGVDVGSNLMAVAAVVENTTNTIIGVNAFDWFLTLVVTITICFVSTLILYRSYAARSVESEAPATEIASLNAELVRVKTLLIDERGMSVFHSVEVDRITQAFHDERKHGSKMIDRWTKARDDFESEKRVSKHLIDNVLHLEDQVGKLRHILANVGREAIGNAEAEDRATSGASSSLGYNPTMKDIERCTGPMSPVVIAPVVTRITDPGSVPVEEQGSPTILIAI